MIVFYARAGGRLFRITRSDGFIVDCRDTRTGYESQALLAAGELGLTSPELIAVPLVRDAIASAYYNATSWESGQYPVGGTALPADFTTELIG